MLPLVEAVTPAQGAERRVQCSEVPIIAVLLIASNLFFFLLVQKANAGLAKGDFKMFYAGALALRSGHAADLYNPDLYGSIERRFLSDLPSKDVKVYTHPPYELLVFWPLSFLGYKAAGYCWIALSIVLGIACGRMLSGYAAVLGLFPFLTMLLEQQDSILALLILIGCWHSLQKGREVWAGFLLGLGLFKFPIVLPLAILLLLWRPAIGKGFALSGSLVILVSVLLVGLGGMRSYARYISAMASRSTAAVSESYHMDPRTNPTLRGLTYEVFSRGQESVAASAGRALTPVLVFLDLLCLGLAVVFVRGNAPPETKFAVALLAALLVGFHVLMHDLILVALPFTLLRGISARWALSIFYLAPLVYLFYPRSQCWLALAVIASLCLVVMSYRRRMAYEPSR